MEARFNTESLVKLVAKMQYNDAEKFLQDNALELKHIVFDVKSLYDAYYATMDSWHADLLARHCRVVFNDDAISLIKLLSAMTHDAGTQFLLQHQSALRLVSFDADLLLSVSSGIWVTSLINVCQVKTSKFVSVDMINDFLIKLFTTGSITSYSSLHQDDKKKVDEKNSAMITAVLNLFMVEMLHCGTMQSYLPVLKGLDEMTVSLGSVTNDQYAYPAMLTFAKLSQPLVKDASELAALCQYFKTKEVALLTAEQMAYWRAHPVCAQSTASTNPHQFFAQPEVVKLADGASAPDQALLAAYAQSPNTKQLAPMAVIEAEPQPEQVQRKRCAIL